MPSTQEFLELDSIKEGVIVLKNKNLRGVLMVSSINFALKTEEEQKAIIYQFQSFLNSLDFSCQILVQSRKINILPYVEGIKELAQRQHNELLKQQMIEYSKFISRLVEEGDVMSKKFFVIVPFDVVSPEKVQEFSWRIFLEAFGRKRKEELTKEEFARAKEQLWQRMEFVVLGLQRIGLRAVPLTSQEIAELIWEIYHPQEAERGYYPTIPPNLLS